MQDMADKLDQLERDGYVLIKGALSPKRRNWCVSGWTTRARWAGRKA